MKNVFIVGGSSGIGKELVNILSESFDNVYASFNKTKPDDNRQNVHYHFLNVMDESQDLSFLPETLDGFVYCPGSINLLPFARIKPDDFLKDYELQVVGAIKILQEVMPKLKLADKPSVVFFSTVAVQTGFNFHSQVSASKGAIEGLTKALAAELAPKFRVNAIAPSLTDTPLASKLLNSDEKKEANAQRHPLKQIGSPRQIAEMAAFLLSDNSSWITGQVLHVDGGMSSIKN